MINADSQQPSPEVNTTKSKQSRHKRNYESNLNSLMDRDFTDLMAAAPGGKQRNGTQTIINKTMPSGTISINTAAINGTVKNVMAKRTNKNAAGEKNAPPISSLPQTYVASPMHQSQSYQQKKSSEADMGRTRNRDVDTVPVKQKKRKNQKSMQI